MGPAEHEGLLSKIGAPIDSNSKGSCREEFHLT